MSGTMGVPPARGKCSRRHRRMVIPQGDGHREGVEIGIA